MNYIKFFGGCWSCNSMFTSEGDISTTADASKAKRILDWPIPHLASDV